MRSFIRRLPLVTIAGGLALLLGAAPAWAQSYHTHTQIGQLLLDAQNNYPALCQRHNLGYSFQGRELWAVCISDNVGVEEDEPEVKYISTMHGDEIIGMEMCLNLVDYLLSNYGVNVEITNLVNGLEIWIVPLMNPDGYMHTPRTRENAQGFDLNRTFPEGSGPSPQPNDPAGRPTEVQIIMNWSFDHSFTLAANMHGGAMVVNYAFDKEYGVDSGDYAATPDDDEFIYISEKYSQYNLPMWNGDWYHGITNGSAWYAITGGMQDWSYRYMGCNEVTIELSDNKQPPASQIPTYWNNNRESMVSYISQCLYGVRGLVTNGAGQPLECTVSVVGRDHEIYTDPDVGDYHRILRPGVYQLVFEADGYEPQTHQVNVMNGVATRLNVVFGSPPPVITTATLPEGFINYEYLAFQLEADGGEPPLEWSVQPGGLLDGLTLSQDGVLSGIPTEAGTFYPVFVVTDAQELSDQEAIELVIHDADPPGGDFEPDGDVDLADFAAFQNCLELGAVGDCRAAFDIIYDGTLNLDDWAEFVPRMTGP